MKLPRTSSTLHSSNNKAANSKDVEPGPSDLDCKPSKSHQDHKSSTNCHEEPVSNQLELLSDEQLKKLTKQNTKRNHGSRKHRLRSQLERVCRRLDNLAVDARLQQRATINALPLVNPEATGTSDSVEVENVGLEASQERNLSENEDLFATDEDDSLDASETVESTHVDGEDAFFIEPATNNSVFSSSEAPGPSQKSVRSVRISTSVTVLDYSTRAKDSEPVSVSTLQRVEHPTRKKNPLQSRAYKNDAISFPKHNAKAKVAQGIPGDSSGNRDNPRCGRGLEFVPKRENLDGDGTTYGVPSSSSPYGRAARSPYGALAKSFNEQRNVDTNSRLETSEESKHTET